MIILNAADVLSATAGAGSALTVTVFGMENTSAAQAFKRLYQGQPGNTATTLYTVPASTQTLIKTITVANTTGSAETLELFAAGTAAANALMPAISIDAGGMAVYDGNGWTFTTSTGAPKEALTVAVDAGTLTGTTLASNVVNSSLTSVGTLATLTVTATITGSVTGNAGTATTLATARAINGVNFDGSAPITVAAAAGTLTGSTLAAGVTASSLTSVGTLTTLSVSGATTLNGKTLNWPSGAGLNTNVLTTDGSGNLSWASAVNTGGQGDISHYNYAVLQMHMDGSNGGTTFTDNSPVGRTVTVSGVTTSTTSPKFGTASAVFGGSTNKLTIADSKDLFLGMDFTIECWVKTTQSLQYATLIDKSNSGGTAGSWTVLFNTSSSTDGIVSFYQQAVVNGSAVVTGATSIRDGNWHHVAVCGTGGVYTIFIDGAPDGQSASSVAWSVSNNYTLTIGNSGISSRAFVGNIDEVRILKGMSAYTSTFTPPTAAYVDGTLAGNGTLDAIDLTGTTMASTVVTSSLTTVGTLSSLTLGGNTTFVNNQVDKPKFLTYTEVVPTPAISTNTLVLDLTTGNTFRVALSANVTTLTISNPATSGVLQSFTLILDQSGSFTVTWPSSVHWAGGTAPTQSATNAKTDIFTFLTTNGGTTWYGFTGGLKFTT